MNSYDMSEPFNMGTNRSAAGDSGDAAGDFSAGVSMPGDESSKAGVTEPDMEIEVNRFLKAYIYEGKRKANPLRKLLKPNTAYTLTINIGPPDETAVMAPETFPGEVVFKDSQAATEVIYLLFKPRQQPDVTPQMGHIVLPRKGESTAYDFTFTTQQTEFEAEVYAYHKNRLLQRLILRASVDDAAAMPEASIRFTMDFCIRQQLANLSDSQAFTTSLFLEAPAGAPANLTALVNNQPRDFRYNSATAQLTADLKTIIEASFRRTVGTPAEVNDLYGEKGRQLFYRLALKGNDLFNTLLKKDKTLKGPFQLITKQIEYVPLDFVYTRAAPDEDAKLCQHAKESLLQGRCGNCHQGELNEEQYICPFGFWALSEVIERHHIRYDYEGSGDYCLKFEPTTNRKQIPVLENTLYGASTRVEAEQPGLLKEITDAITPQAKQLKEATDWQQFEQLADQIDPDSIVLIVHTEQNQQAFAMQLEIGKGHFLIKNKLNETLLKAANSTRAPFTIILGCEAADTQNFGFDITTQLMTEGGAAIVISNFTKIRGSHAALILMKLVALLKQYAGSGVTLGELLLKARQLLVAQGVLVSLTLAAQGDADWIL